MQILILTKSISDCICNFSVTVMRIPTSIILPPETDWASLLFQCSSHLLGTLSCMSPCQTPSALSLSVTSSIVCCFFSCTSLFLLPSLLVLSHAFSLHLHHLLFLIFHSPAAPPVLFFFSVALFVLPFQVHLLFPLTFNAPCVPHIIIPPSLSIIPSTPLSTLSETMSADTRPSPQPHSSLIFIPIVQHCFVMH